MTEEAGNRDHDHYGEVRIQTLEPLHIATYQSISSMPEHDAFEHMKQWLPRQHIDDTSAMRAFGFDVELSERQKQQGLRGYEVWISVPAAVQPSEDVALKDFAGGLYAVMKISDPFADAFNTIPQGWQRLWGWANESDQYMPASHQWLEEHKESAKGPYLDICLPIAPRQTTPPKQPAQPQIVQMGTLRLAGLRYEGKNEHGEIPALWDKDFLPRMGELAAIRVGGEAYGVSRQAPGLPVDQGFEYLAAVQVQSFDHLPAGMVGWEIPALTYAVLPAHDLPEIAPVCDYFHQEWLPQSQTYTSGEPLMLELYPETYGQDLIMQLCFPVRPR
ncbi:MAG: effector binding domain-containing protein [Chloroflexi bacterium]|nr:effector binding domain-containing protein [Chloroflexota bacterium]